MFDRKCVALRAAVLATGVLVAVVIAAAASTAQAVAWRAIHGATSQRYQEWVGQCEGDGYRPTFVQGYEAGNGVQFAAIAVKDGLAWRARHNLDSDGFQTAFNSITADGFRVNSISGYRDGDTIRYAATFVKDDDRAWRARNGLTANGYQNAFTDLTGEGYRPVQVVGFNAGDEARYCCLFEKGEKLPWLARHGMDGNAFQQFFNAETPKGYRPLSVSGYNTPDGVRYALVMVKDNTGWKARHNLTSARYEDEFKASLQAGMRLSCLSGYYDGVEVRYAAVWVKND